LLKDAYFTDEGLLPPGDYVASLHELRQSLLVMGTHELSDWDMPWRSFLVDQLEILAVQLWHVGIQHIFLNGSFVENKGHPNDIDGYFVCDFAALISGHLEESLNQRDPHKIWTCDPASRRPHRGYPKRQLPMWHQYRVELYPHYGQGTGVCDEHGHEFEFPSLFRQQRATGQLKGIVVLTKDN
jgi:hypothetical protein